MTSAAAGSEEHLVRQIPVVVRRRVKWGECDPAGVVYTPRFADFAVSAFEHLFGHLLGEPMHAGLGRHGWGLPMKAMSFTFHRSLWPSDQFDMEVRVAALRVRTFDLVINATLVPSAQPTFSARLTPIMVDIAGRLSRPIAPELRASLLDYAAQCGDTPEIAEGGEHV